MSKQRLIDELAKLVVDCADRLAFQHKPKVIEVREWLHNTIIEHGLYQRWTEIEIVEHIQTMSIKDMSVPLNKLWSLQTASEKKFGSAETLNQRGFGGKYNEVLGRWTGDAAIAKKFVDAYKKIKAAEGIPELQRIRNNWTEEERIEHMENYLDTHGTYMGHETAEGIEYVAIKHAEEAMSFCINNSEKLRKLLLKYRKQLTKIANNRAYIKKLNKQMEDTKELLAERTKLLHDQTKQRTQNS